MKQNISLRLRVTLVCGILLAVCCLLLTISHNYYATKMADSIAATPLQPAQTVGETVKDTTDAVTLSQIALPARKTFRTQSMIAMGVIVTMGCLSVYWLTSKALAPLHQLDEQIRRRTAADLDQPLPVPSSADEVAGLTISFNQMSHNLSKSRSRQFGGAGLGLSLVRAIAELHQGRITASSTQGRGTCFVMTLPRERKSP